MTAKGADITGTITTSNIKASGGTIGGWRLNQDSLYNVDTSSPTYIMTGNISTTSTNDTGTYIGSGYIINGGEDGSYKLAWIHNGAIDLTRQPYKDSPYRNVITSDMILGYSSSNSNAWFMVDNINEKVAVNGSISCSSLYATNNIKLNLDSYLLSYQVMTGTTKYISILGKSSGGNIWLGHYSADYTSLTTTIQLNASSVYARGTFYTPDGTVSKSDSRLKSNITDIDITNIVVSADEERTYCKTYILNKFISQEI